MNTTRARHVTTSRRHFIGAVVATGVAPLFVPGHVLGLNGQTPPSEKVTLGVIGVGAQGRSDMSAFLQQKDVQITALCDVNKRNLSAARKEVAAKYGRDDIKEYHDFRELNADRTVDAVLMALPFHWHSLAALDAISHGKHIYHEKPMAMSFAEGRRIREAVRKKGVVFQFGTQQRSETKFRAGCEIALNGCLGKVKEILVSVPGGKKCPLFPEEPVPDYVDWNRWVGPAPIAPFNRAKLQRDNHENITNFSLGMIACWGIHHLDIANWGNGTDATGPRSVEGSGEFPRESGCDAILNWKVRFEFANAAPVTFVNDGTAGFEHGVRFIGDSEWVHVRRGSLTSSNESLLRDPKNAVGTMPIKLQTSPDHFGDFISAIKTKTRPTCDVDTAMRSDTLCQLALIAVKSGRKLQWDPARERFTDDAANAMLEARPFRGDWKLPEV